jgi:spore coat protein A
VLRDAHLDEKGVLVFSMFSEPGARSTILANGRPQPYFPVAARKYRFRLLNSANERVFRLSLGGVELTQIASDGGLLPAPVPRTELLIGSAERMEVVVDFSRYPIGTQLVLTDAETGPVLRFDVVRHAQDDSRVPAQLRPLPVLPPATTVRDVDLSFDLSGEMPVGLVNGKAFNPDHVDFTVKRGATEIWRVINGDGAIGAPHTFHMHLVQFQVLDRGDKPLWPSDVGRKDTVQVPPGESVRVKATFSRDFVGRYVYHCHFLEHSALGMMAQLEVVS